METLQTNLKDAPDYLNQVIGLIEKEFGYLPEFKFEIDFYPLLEKSNLKNCHILIDKTNKQLIGHIGVLEKKIEIDDKKFTIPLLGGIAISSDYQHKGFFSPFFRDVINKYKEKSPFMILWSDKEEIFNRFEFYSSGRVFEYNTENNNDFLNIEKKRLNNLTQDEIEKLISIFNKDQKWRTSFKRKKEHWDTFSKITSTNLYIFKEKTNNDIVGYAFRGKGQDLTDIIHEYACLKDYRKDFYRSLPQNSLVWTPEKLDLNNSRTLSFGLIRINDEQEVWKEFLRLWFQDNKKETKDKTSRDLLNIIFSSTKNNPRGVFWVSGLESI